ncbi:MAG: signal peptidase I [Rickettsiales bacterium]|jgi:signal peptidase I|nr:signal peptidase I [Rickettsiales bacterium]
MQIWKSIGDYFRKKFSRHGESNGIKNLKLDPKDNTNSNFGELLRSVIYALIFAILVRSFLYEPYHIPSGSMKPGLVEGDFIFVSKFSYGYSRYSLPFGLPLIKERIFNGKKPQRGDVIVFKLPRNPKINYIKRLIGLPGDTVIVKNSLLYINGEEIARKYVGEYSNPLENSPLLMFSESLAATDHRILQARRYNPYGDGEFVVPDGYYFFMGDNRDNSSDSRFPETGFVPYRNLVGRAVLIFFSKSDSIFKFWKWPNSFRFKRFFRKIG